MGSVDQQREHFESIADDYFHARQHPNHLLLKKLIWQHFFARNSHVLPQGATVIEAMCGYSEGKAILEQHCHSEFKYAGFDYSESLVERAKKEFPDADIYVQDVTQFAPTQQYDLMILIGGLHHVYSHVQPVVARLADAIKPGGYLINFEPTQNNALYRWARNRIYKKNDLFDDDTEQAFDLTELNDLYRHGGLVIEDQVYPGLLAYIMYYNPDAFPLLNIGPAGMVKALHWLEKPFYRGFLAKYFSFATLSLLRKES